MGHRLLTPLQRFIRERMDALKIPSYAALGRRAGLPGGSVHNLATQPRRAMPREETLEALAPALGVTVEQLREKAYEGLGPSVRRGDRLVSVVGDLESMSDLDLLKLQEAVTTVQEAINQEQRRRHERSH